MKFILGTKQSMTQVFTDDGKVIPATIITAGPIVVTAIKTEERDGYTAVQVGYGVQKEKRVSKPVLGHTKDLGAFKVLKEFKVTAEEAGNFKVGDSIDISVFEAGDTVGVTGISKGKGFQGGVKRHGFAGGRRSHGQKHSEREVGSIGAGGIQRVFKGQRMPGRMGTDQVTVKNLKVVQADSATGILVVSGAIPGRRGTLIEVRG